MISLSKTQKILLIVVIAVLILAALVTLLIYLGTSYTVTYLVHGGQIDEDSTWVWHDSDYRLPIPAKSGYTFAGWYFGDTYVPEEGLWQYEQDVTLEARWKIIDENGVSYYEKNDAYIIDYYAGKMKSNIVFPTTFQGLPIVGVEDRALDFIKNNIDASPYGYVKIYLPSTVSSANILDELDYIRVNRYSVVGNDNFIYLDEGEYYSVVGYTGAYDSDITVPEEYNGKPIKSIGDNAFYGAGGYVNVNAIDFVKIKIPHSVVSIGKNAFEKCDFLKVVLYSSTNGTVRETTKLSTVFDWMQNVNVDTGNGDFLKVIAHICPAFGWNDYTHASYYIKLNTDGGEIRKKIEAPVGAGGSVVMVTVLVEDMTVEKNQKYTLPTPERDGYIFDGWYYGEDLVEQEGNSWCFDTHVELVAKWTKK